MQQKNNIRFLKKITVLSVVMNIIITLCALFLFFLNNEMTSGHLSALLGAWSIELALGAFIKNNEVKLKSDENLKNESVDTDLNNSI